MVNAQINRVGAAQRRAALWIETTAFTTSANFTARFRAASAVLWIETRTGKRTRHYAARMSSSTRAIEKSPVRAAVD
jgi:hypothetical protein